jgi:hypothetical protein
MPNIFLFQNPLIFNDKTLFKSYHVRHFLRLSNLDHTCQPPLTESTRSPLCQLYFSTGEWILTNTTLK